jgi:outer membrane protein TolC
MPAHPTISPSRLLALTLGLTLSSCTIDSYTERADEDVYGLLASAQQVVLPGEVSEFSIDTPLSDREPAGLSSADIIKDRSSTERLALTIDQALSLAIKKNRTYQDEKENLYLTALTLTGEQHNFRPQLFATSTGTQSWFSGGQLPNGNSVERRSALSSDVGFTQLLLTGGEIGVNIANDILRFSTGDSRKSSITAITANITQPLLRGAGRKIAAERLTQAHRNVIYAVRDFSDFQSTFSTEIVVQYFRLLQQKDTLYNQFANYQSRVETTAYLRARAIDRAKPLDVGSAAQDELTARNSYIASVVSFKNAEDTFKITLGLPTSTRLVLDDSEMQELRAAGPLRLFLNPPTGFKIALDHRLPLLNSIDRFEDAQRQIMVAADALKPGFDIFADVSLDNDNDLFDYTNFEFRDIRTNVGFALDLPVNKTIERNNLRATQINFEAAARTLGLTFDELRNSIDQSIRQLAQFRQSYIINKNALDLSLRRAEGSRLQLEAGTALFRDLQDAQDALISAQNDLTAALVDYLEARLGLLTDLGILETRGKFWLRANASSVDLSHPPADALPATFLKGEQIITPDQLFSD